MFMDHRDIFNLQVFESEFKSPPAQMPTDSDRKFRVESERLQNVCMWVCAARVCECVSDLWSF